MTEANGTITAGLAHWDCVPQAVTEVFDATCGVKVKSVDEATVAGDEGSIVAVIWLGGDVEWTIVLGLPAETACAVAGAFAGFDIPFESDEMADAIGEMSSILAGHVKSLLSRRNINAAPSLPSVIRGTNVRTLIPQGVDHRTHRFDSSLGKMEVSAISAATAGGG